MAGVQTSPPVAAFAGPFALGPPRHACVARSPALTPRRPPMLRVSSRWRWRWRSDASPAPSPQPVDEASKPPPVPASPKLATPASARAPPPPHEPAQARWRGRLLLASAAAACAVALAMLLRRLGGAGAALAAAEAFVARVGVVRGCFGLFVLNFCTVLFCFPANMGLIIAAGALLGAGPAFVALHASKVAAACAAFLLARGALAPRVARALAERPRARAALAAAGADAGWRFVLLMRLSPLPGFLLNYALSLTPVPFWEYALATAVGVAPSIANLCLLGAAARDVGAAATGASPAATPAAAALRGACIAAMLVVSVMAGRRARAAFDALRADPPEEDEEAALTSSVEAPRVEMFAPHGL